MLAVCVSAAALAVLAWHRIWWFLPIATFSYANALVGYLAFTWLLRHVSATLAGTTAYVNPLVAVLVGALLANEAITGRIVLGMGVIFAGVALVRQGRHPVVAEPPAGAPPEPIADTDGAPVRVAAHESAPGEGKSRKMGL